MYRIPISSFPSFAASVFDHALKHTIDSRVQMTAISSLALEEEILSGRVVGRDSLAKHPERSALESLSLHIMLPIIISKA